ncbi:DegQ family serine endoprotease [Limoniibacter endophyticus]|uniref:Serine endoprotease DegQ n=1 Tax=Limoniibacter endophyticus TaxID=1565040 RepID=A0A8J3DK06_9HYPH|nr:DegQ family serine endoprotease [Limoniibacter endophyticus]GHC63161.1 serine endoprotease DegQ [Limoniibacter endophyticus]
MIFNQGFGMRFTKAVFFAILATNVAFAPAVAQEQNKGVVGQLSDLLRGNTTAPADKRVPFSREEVTLSYAPLVRETAPAVVNVYASQEVRPSRSPFAGDPFFEQFFGRQQMAPRQRSSLGSGVIVDAGGFIVTNNHVIADADKIKVALADGREFDSQVVLKDESLDLAILKIAGSEEFPVLRIGDSDALEVGDLVLAMGNPFGVGQTTTSGIISGLARSHVGITDFGFFIQTDAAINPGNSGGALIDMHGSLIGINTAIFSRSGGSIGIGFAIPSNLVAAVVEAAKRGDDFFERPYIGAEFAPVTAMIAESLGLNRPHGALVASVVEGSPAQKAGLQAGDLVTGMDGQPIDNVDALGYRLATRPMGTTSRLTVVRNGDEQEMEITTERAPEGDSANQIVLSGDSPFAGAKVAALSPRLAQQLNKSASRTGVVILETERGSPSARFGFRPGDIVLDVNGTQIGSVEQLQQITSADTRLWRFAVDRDGQVLRQILRY